jgi:hypothetical protein
MIVTSTCDKYCHCKNIDMFISNFTCYNVIMQFYELIMKLFSLWMHTITYL